jgi:hypothetical protein
MDIEYPRRRTFDLLTVYELIEGQPDQGNKCCWKRCYRQPVTTNLKCTAMVYFRFEAINQRPAVLARMTAIDEEVAAPAMKSKKC